MKLKLYILTFVLSISLGALAQGDIDKIGQLLQGGKVQEAVDLSNQLTATGGKGESSAKAWYYKGFAYKELHKTSKSDDDRKTAISSLQKSIELDQAHEFDGEDIQIINYLATSIFNDAVAALNSQQFAKAYDYYDQYISAIISVDPKKVESKTIFYAGYTAYMSGNLEDAILYLEKAKKMNYADPLLYEFLGTIYWKHNDKEKSIEVLEEGTEKFPLYKDIVLLEVKYLLALGKLDILDAKLSKAISLDPTNNELKFMRALHLEQSARFNRDQADVLLAQSREVYKQIIAADPNHIRGNYNLGLSYYNEAVNKMNNLDEDDDDLFALMEIQDVCIDLFKEALPYMEKANNLDPENKDILIGLSGIYFSLNNGEKHNQIQEKITALEGKDSK